jgi:hypothetical protein
MRRFIISIFTVVMLLSLSAALQASEVRLQMNSKNAYYPDGYKGIEEAEMVSSSPDANTGGNWDMMVGSDDKAGVHRLLFRWNIDKLAPLFNDKNIVIISTKIRLGEWYTHKKPNQKFEVYRILPVNKDWVEGKTGIGTWETPEIGAVTWNSTISGSKLWAGAPGCGKPGVDYDPTPVAVFNSDTDIRSMQPRYMAYFDLPMSLVKSWAVNPDNNNGLLVKAVNETGDNLVYVISSQHNRQDYGWHLHHPELVVTYMDKRIMNAKASGYITRTGRPGCIIVTPKDATSGEQYAATELANHIKQISGTEIIQLREDIYKPMYGPYISVGRTKLSKKYVSDKQFAAFGDESYKVFPKDGNLIIIGGRKRGSLYAVYQLLESFGVKWYSPDYTVIPKQANIKMPTKPFEFSPRFWYRDQYWDNGTTPEWMARIRANGEYARIPDDMGGSSHTLYGCHSFFALIPPEEFFTKHPEWFAVKEDGKRSTTEYCLTDQTLRDYVRDRALSEVKATDGWAEYIWVSQNDGSLSGCFCDKCTAEREAHGGKDKWAANTVSFVNYVADAMAKQFPKVKIKTLAYSYTTEVPSNIKVADNISIELCGNFMPGDKDPHTKLAKSWAKIAKNIEVYTYGGSNFGYWWPYPNMWEMGAQYSRALNAGVSAFYVQGTAVGKGSGMVDLRAYLSGRLAWDPSRDMKKETKDFCNGFYGPGGKYVYEYIKWYSDYVKKHKMKVDGGWGNADLWRDWVTKEAMDYSDSLFKKALEAVKDNPIYTNHVRRAYLEVIWGSVMVNLNKKPDVVGGNYVLISGANAGDLLAKTKLFNEIMTENSYNMMSEPVGWIAGRSQLDAVANNYPAVGMSNSAGKLWIVPSLGGRIIIWNVDALGGSIFRISGGADPYSAGYEELSGLPTKTIKYEVVSAAPASVVIKGAVTGDVESTRSFELDSTKSLLRIVSEYKNVSEKPVKFTIRTHPEFSFKSFGKSSLYTMENGKWATRTLWTKNNPEGSTYVESNTVSKGVWLLGDSDKNIALINRFDLFAVKTMYAYHGESYGGINLELWSPDITLQPGETWKLDHSYEIATDLKSVTESEIK